MRKIFVFFVIIFLATSTVFAQCGQQPCASGQQQIQVPLQAFSLPFDQNGKIKPGTYQGSVYVLRSPEYNRVISVIFFISGNNTPFEINGVFTQKTPADWVGFFLRSELKNLKNKIYEQSGFYDNTTGEGMVTGGEYITPKRLPALLHFDETGSWAEILLK